MKLLYLPLTFFLFGCATVKSERTGIVYASHFEILSRTKISEKWNDALRKNDIDSRLSIFKIRKNRDATTNEPYYFLYAESYDEKTKAAMILTRKHNYFFAAKQGELAICPCLEGNPRLTDNQWKCESQAAESPCEEIILTLKPEKKSFKCFHFAN